MSAQSSEIRLVDLRPGDLVKIDRARDPEDCLQSRKTLRVRSNKIGLFVKCRQGEHYLDGLEREDGTLIGVRRVTQKEST